MKKLLDWKRKEIVDIFDEATLWSAPFGRLLLENIPMKSGATIVDIGFGTGFPLIELSQRFGETSKIYGIDIWEEAINKVRYKIDILGLENIEILKENASAIRIDDNQIDLVTSNLGVNNFEDKGEVYKEIRRILKRGGRLCITTNPIGTFAELFELFNSILITMKLDKELNSFRNYIDHRGTKALIISEFESKGLKFLRSKFDSVIMRFADAEAIVNHSLIRIGFREYWEKMIREEKRVDFFKHLLSEISKIIKKEGEFKITIPMLYLEFTKE